MMNEATRQFLNAVAHDPTLTNEQKLLIDIVTRMNGEVLDEVIDRLVDAQAEQATPLPVPASSSARR